MKEFINELCALRLRASVEFVNAGTEDQGYQVDVVEKSFTKGQDEVLYGSTLIKASEFDRFSDEEIFDLHFAPLFRSLRKCLNQTEESTSGPASPA